jgi:hypothetical protein
MPAPRSCPSRCFACSHKTRRPPRRRCGCRSAAWSSAMASVPGGGCCSTSMPIVVGCSCSTRPPASGGCRRAGSATPAVTPCRSMDHWPGSWPSLLGGTASCSKSCLRLSGGEAWRRRSCICRRHRGRRWRSSTAVWPTPSRRGSANPATAAVPGGRSPSGGRPATATMFRGLHGSVCRDRSTPGIPWRRRRPRRRVSMTWSGGGPRAS